MGAGKNKRFLFKMKGDTGRMKKKEQFLLIHLPRGIKREIIRSHSKRTLQVEFRRKTFGTVQNRNGDHSGMKPHTTRYSVRMFATGSLSPKSMFVFGSLGGHYDIATKQLPSLIRFEL